MNKENDLTSFVTTQSINSDLVIACIEAKIYFEVLEIKSHAKNAKLFTQKTQNFIIYLLLCKCYPLTFLH
jgi:hypothetical protein